MWPFYYEKTRSLQFNWVRLNNGQLSWGIWYLLPWCLDLLWHSITFYVIVDIVDDEKKRENVIELKDQTVGTVMLCYVTPWPCVG